MRPVQNSHVANDTRERSTEGLCKFGRDLTAPFLLIDETHLDQLVRIESLTHALENVVSKALLAHVGHWLQPVRGRPQGTTLISGEFHGHPQRKRSRAALKLANELCGIATGGEAEAQLHSFGQVPSGIDRIDLEILHRDLNRPPAAR